MDALQCVWLYSSQMTDHPAGNTQSSIFIGLNLLAFLFISLAYLAIFLSAVKSSSSIRSTNVKRESALAKRVTFIILTDFCCWMPVIVVGILSLTGGFHDPEKQVYVWMAVFVLPVNSSVKPSTVYNRHAPGAEMAVQRFQC